MRAPYSGWQALEHPSSMSQVMMMMNLMIPFLLRHKKNLNGPSLDLMTPKRWKKPWNENVLCRVLNSPCFFGSPLDLYAAY
ncbi:hypothetical protein XENTR_v10024029 [Xenopus tropicalis]|nr:hypothetical protein XENTR_v10024029 [Xenopus tropicalis]